MKKTVLVVLLSLLMVVALTACSADEPAAQQPAEQPAAEQPAEEQTETPVVDFPTDTITIVCGFSAGGGTDTAARVMATYLAEELGVNVVVENLPGGNGINAALDVLEREQDGYTLLASNDVSFIVAPLMFDEPYDAVTDYVQIGTTGSSSMILTAGPASPVTTIDEFVAYAKDHPGEVTVGTAGLADVSGISAYRTFVNLGVECTIVPYDSAAESAAACAGGHVMYCNSTISGIDGYVKDNTLTPMLDTTGGIEDTPYGVASMDDYTTDITPFYRTISAAVGVPAERVQILRDALEKVMNSEELLAAFEDINDPIKGFMNGEQAQQQVATDQANFRVVVDELGLAEK